MVLAPDKTEVQAPDKTEVLGSEQAGHEVPVPEGLRKKYLGSYDFGVTTARVYEKDGRLSVESTLGSSPMIHQGEGVFVVAFAPSMRLMFEVEGDDTFLTFKDGKTVRRGSRQPAGPQFKAMPELNGVRSGEVCQIEQALSGKADQRPGRGE